MKPVLIIALILSWVFFLIKGVPLSKDETNSEAFEVSVTKAETLEFEKRIEELEADLKKAEKKVIDYDQIMTRLSIAEEEAERWRTNALEKHKKAIDLIEEMQNKEKEIEAAAKTDEENSAKADRKAKDQESHSMAKAMREMMKADGMQEMVKLQVEQQFNRLWSDFAPEMTAELREVVMEKLKTRQLNQALGGMRFFEMNPEEKKNWAKTIKEENESFEREIDNLLGLEYAPLYKDYQLTLPGRLQFETFKQMGYAPGSQETEKKVRDAFIAAQRTVAGQTPEQMPEAFDGESVNLHSQKMIDHQKTLVEEVLVQSKESLTNQEHQELADRLQHYQKQMEVGIKMSRAFMADENEEEGEGDSSAE